MKMKIDYITIFPEYFTTPLTQGQLRLAQDKGLVSFTVHNLRDYTDDPHRKVDDYPYGGGPGMVMKPEPFFKAVDTIAGAEDKRAQGFARIILLTPQGRVFDQRLAQELAGEERLVFLCGRYEGIDERVREHLVTDEISLGDYIISGGEAAALVVTEAVVRLIPGVVGDELSVVDESFSQGLLEYPQYTRPSVFRGWQAPKILLGGNHQEIERWKKKQSLERTKKRRPDLLKKDEGKERKQK